MSIAPAITPPSAVEGNLLQADAEISQLWTDVWNARDDLETADIRAVGAFYDSWKSYLATKPSTFWGATYDNVQNWRRRAAEWWDKAAAWGVNLHGVRPDVEEPSNAPLVAFGFGVTGLVAVAVIVVVLMVRK